MKLSQRKYILAWYFALVGTVALFIDKIKGGEFIALVTLILTIYNAANVYSKRKELRK